MNRAQRSIRRFFGWLFELTDSWEPVERVLSLELEQELLAHSGQWVALTHDRLLAFGSNASEVLATARAGGEAMPILYRVPEAGMVFL